MDRRRRRRVCPVGDVMRCHAVWYYPKAILRGARVNSVAANKRAQGRHPMVISSSTDERRSGDGETALTTRSEESPTIGSECLTRSRILIFIEEIQDFIFLFLKSLNAQKVQLDHRFGMTRTHDDVKNVETYQNQ
jgi:hypothetical protein